MHSKSAVVAVAICAGLLGQAALVAEESGAKQPPQATATQTRELGKRVFTNSIGMKFVRIPKGEFVMGADEAADDVAEIFRDDTSNYKNEHPKHRVRITRPFLIGAYEVTVGQFRRFVESEGYATEAEADGVGTYGFNPETRKLEGRTTKYNWKNVGWTQTDDHPVVNVSWNDALAFCEWLSRKEQLTYALPTEAQWEYACRAGTRTRYFHGNDPETLPTVANIADASLRSATGVRWGIRSDDGFPFSAPVGSFKPNDFGLYDMIGNVSEWCADWYDETYYENSPSIDPTGPQAGNSRVIRGGSLRNPPAHCRCALRYRGSPNSRRINGGFRVVLHGADHPPTSKASDADEDGVLTSQEGTVLRAKSTAAVNPKPTLADVRYGSHPRNVLDFYRAKTTQDGPSPVLIYFHSGAFVRGDKRDTTRGVWSVDLGRNCLRNGISVVSANYRFTKGTKEVPGEPFPAPIFDGARVIQYVRSRAEQWNIDPARIALSGGSAGAYMSVWLAVNDDLANDLADDPVARHSTRVRCVVSYSGPTTVDPNVILKHIGGNPSIYPDFEFFFGVQSVEELKDPKLRKLIDDANPLLRVSRDDPPLYLHYQTKLAGTPLPPDTPMGVSMHHAMFGRLMQQRYEPLGLECHLVCDDVPAKLTELEFLRRHLR